MKRLFRWPMRGRIKAVTFTFRLVPVQGEMDVPMERRTYPFTVVVEKGQKPERIQLAVALKASEIGADMAGLMERAVLDAINEELNGAA